MLSSVSSVGIATHKLAHVSIVFSSSRIEISGAVESTAVLSHFIATNNNNALTITPLFCARCKVFNDNVSANRL